MIEEVNVMEYRSLHQDELPKWFSHCAEVFSPNFAGNPKQAEQYFMNHWYNDPWRSEKCIFVAMDGDVIASTVRIFNREIYCLGYSLKMGGIGEVSTKNAYRNQGLVSHLLKMAIKYMEDNDYVLSLLAGDAGIYSRWGWDPIVRETSTITFTGVTSEQVRMRPIDWDQDLQTIHTLYTACMPQINGPIVRDQVSYWQHWVRQELSRVSLAFLIEDLLGNALGYLLAKEKDGLLAILEYGSIPGSITFEDAVKLLVHTLGISEKQVQFPVVFAPGLPLLKKEKSDGWMLKVIDSNKLQKAIGITDQAALLNLWQQAGSWMSILDNF